jgi:CDP-paratose 2-epimerase
MRRPVPVRSVLIFGGAGFIGSNWARYLLTKTDARVHVFDNLSRAGVRHNLRALQLLAKDPDRLKITVADIRNPEHVNEAVASANEIYHFAAQVAVTSSLDDPRLDFEVNVGGTLNILEAARKTGRRPFLLFTSTNKVYGHLDSHRLTYSPLRCDFDEPDGICEYQPLDFYSPYGCSKGAADQYVHDYARIFGLPTVVFRMSCIAGPSQFGNEDQGWVAHFLYSVLQGRDISIYGDGRQVRDVLAVQDLVRAFDAVRSRREQTAGEVYNVGGGRKNAISLLELMQEISVLTGRQPKYHFRPRRPGDQLVYITDFSKLERATDWRPRMSVLDIVNSIYGWWKEHQDLFMAEPLRFPAPPAMQQMPEVAS